jgi:hypothetical protein
MTPRRAPGRGQTPPTWKDPRRRPELLKAIGAGSAIVLITALTIFLIKPDDPASAPTQTPIQTPVSSVPSELVPDGSTPDTTPSTTPSTTPGDTTDTTVPTESSTIPTQP